MSALREHAKQGDDQTWIGDEDSRSFLNGLDVMDQFFWSLQPFSGAMAICHCV
jgi:hypothetical protein